MGHFNIVIEGIDGTGKSTLAKALRAELSEARLTLSSETKPHSRPDMLVALARARGAASLEGVNIFDRCYAISEAVYQDNGGLTLWQIQRELKDCNIDLLIWARRPIDNCVVKVREDDPRDVEYNKTLARRLPEIAGRYDSLMPVLMDFMLHEGHQFELYTKWEDEFEFKVFVHKIALMCLLAK